MHGCTHSFISSTDWCFCHAQEHFTFLVWPTLQWEDTRQCPGASKHHPQVVGEFYYICRTYIVFNLMLYRNISGTWQIGRFQRGNRFLLFFVISKQKYSGAILWWNFRTFAIIVQPLRTLKSYYSSKFSHEFSRLTKYIKLNFLLIPALLYVKCWGIRVVREIFL